MRTRRVVTWVVIGATVVAVCWLVYREFYGGPTRFDDSFYATTRSAGPFSYDDYAAALKYVDGNGMVNYAGLKADRARLDAFCRSMAAVDRKSFDKWDDSAKIAFWINAYNALTLKAIVDNYPIQAGLVSGLAFPSSSIRQIAGVWDKQQFLVLGKKMTLDQIEHKVLRTEFKEPRIHMAIVCAAMGCPPLRNEPFTGPKLDAQLDDQTRRFLAGKGRFRIDRSAGKVYLSRILSWFSGDFAAKYAPATQADKSPAGRDRNTQAVLNFVSRYLPDADAAYLREGRYGIEYLKYDWSLNEQE